MPIVNENQGGLKRYAVFAFVEDQKPGNPNSHALRFPLSPNASSLEASTKLGHTEMFHMKRLKSLEKGVNFPFVDVTFFSSYQNVEEMKNLLEPSDCVNLHDHNVKLQKGIFEEVQLVDPKRDMIMTPIDFDDVITERLIGKGVTSQNKVPIPKKEVEIEEDYKKTRGYIVIAYKTMEHMYSRDFVTSWKTWTGVRYICMQLPRQLGLRRIAFYRQISTTSDFTYVLIIEIMNLLIFAAQTLNLMDGIKLRLCGYTAIFREMDFQVDLATAAVHHLETSYRAPERPFGTPKINISRHDSVDSSSTIENGNRRDSIDELSDMVKKKKEVANRRRQEQELAKRIEEQRKAKLFKIFGKDAVPDYAPPPPPIMEVSKRVEDMAAAAAAPKASPESEPDMTPSSPVHQRKLHESAVKPAEIHRVPVEYVKRQALTPDVGAVHGEYLPEKKSSPKYMPHGQVAQPKPLVQDAYLPVETAPRQVVHSSQLRSGAAHDVKYLTIPFAQQPPQQQPQVVFVQRYSVPESFEPHRLPPPYGAYPPYPPYVPPEPEVQEPISPAPANNINRRRSEMELAIAGQELVRTMQMEPFVQMEIVHPQPSDSESTDPNFNSPVYSRSDWKQGSSLYPGEIRDEQIHHLAHRLGSMQETAILEEDADRDRRKRDGESRRSIKTISKGLADAINRARDVKREIASHRRELERDRSHSFGHTYGSPDRTERIGMSAGVSLAERRQVYFKLQEKSRNFLEQYPLAKHRKSMPGSTHELLLALENGELEAEFKSRKKHKERPAEPVNLHERPDIVEKHEAPKQAMSSHQPRPMSPRHRALPRIPVLRDSPSPPVRMQRPAAPQPHQSRRKEIPAEQSGMVKPKQHHRPSELRPPSTPRVASRSPEYRQPSDSSQRRQGRSPQPTTSRSQISPATSRLQMSPATSRSQISRRE